jgi:ER lumen protein retaining receptor
MKLVFLGTSCAIVYYIRYHRIIRLTYDKDQDTFRHWMLIAPAAVLALISAHPRTIMEVRDCNHTASVQHSIQPQLICTAAEPHSAADLAAAELADSPPAGCVQS